MKQVTGGVNKSVDMRTDTFFLPKAQNERLAIATTQLSGVSTKAWSKLFRTPTSSRLIHCPLVSRMRFALPIF
jgi:hypothetical protein